MSEVYKFRIGDMVWNTQDATGEPANIIGLVYKLTPKYAYYAAVSYTHLTLPTNREV